MHLTVAICTWNRSELLRQTMQSLVGMRPAKHYDWDLLVVNNNCTDATEEVLSEFLSRLPLRRIFEAQPGLSNARNAAVRAATGDYILWTDDDVLVSEDWLSGYADAIRRWPGAAFFGGPVLPWFAVPPPEWLTRSWSTVRTAFAVRELGDEAFAFNDQLLPFGANYAVRTSVQRAFEYDPQLGRVKKDLASGEETKVLKSLLSHGHTGFWVPPASVRHYLPQERLTLRYLRRYYSAEGEVEERSAGPFVGARVAGYPRWLLKAWVQAEAKYCVSRLWAAPERWMPHLVCVNRCRGMLRAHSARRPALTRGIAV
jgi:glucosyl-dolichyl phosphate glucuronosyltransferase